MFQAEKAALAKELEALRELQDIQKAKEEALRLEMLELQVHFWLINYLTHCGVEVERCTLASIHAVLELFNKFYRILNGGGYRGYQTWAIWGCPEWYGLIGASGWGILVRESILFSQFVTLAYDQSELCLNQGWFKYLKIQIFETNQSVVIWLVEWFELIWKWMHGIQFDLKILADFICDFFFHLNLQRNF